MYADLFAVDDLRLLIGKKREQWRVSIFMPTHSVTTGVQEDQIRFKNLVKEAEDKLVEAGSGNANVLMEPARKLLLDRSFWHHQSDGLALFLSKDLVRMYRLPIRFNERVVVTDRFHTKPVLPLLTGDGRFYLLALSQNQVSLFLCTRYSVNEVDLEGMPRSLDDALKYDETEKPLQFHSHTPGGVGKKGATFHGQGVGIDEAKDHIFRFFQEVDRGLQNVLTQERAPMVIASVDYLAPIFRQASVYPRVLEQSIPGNPEGISPEDLHKKALDIVTPEFAHEISDRKALYEQLTGTGKVASHVEEVVKAAYHGRVEVLFVALGVQRWGEFDSSKDEVKLLREEEPGAGDLLDFAAAQTLLNGGTVYAVSPDDIPDDNAPLAAIYRY